jgi:hypothetical protein
MHNNNYFISNKDQVEECVMEENMDVIGAVNSSCLKRGF